MITHVSMHHPVSGLWQGAVVMAAATLLSCGPALAEERTIDLVFRTFDKVEGRFQQLEEANTEIVKRVEVIQKEKAKAIDAYQKAQTAPAKVSALRSAKAHVTLKISQELQLRARQMAVNQQILTDVRAQLSGLREQLRQGLSVGGRQVGDSETLERFRKSLQSFGENIEDLLVFTQDKEEEDYFSRISDVSLMALRRQYDELVGATAPTGTAAVGKQLYRTVDGYVRLLDHLLVFYSSMGVTLGNQRQLVYIANQLALAQLLSDHVTNSVSLNSAKLNERLKKEVTESNLMSAQIKEFVLGDYIQPPKQDKPGPSSSFVKLKRPNGRFF